MGVARLGRVLTLARDTARLMIGLPSYDAYRAHMAERHPERAPMSEAEFFRERQEARFGAKGGGKCC